MLDETAKNLDGVVVSTPDPIHAGALLGAIRRGKPVYSEKPLAHSIEEVRTLLESAREQKGATQLGNHGHSTETIRRFKNNATANASPQPTYRQGWSLKG